MRYAIMALTLGPLLTSWFPARAAPAYGVIVFDGDSVSRGTGASSPERGPDSQLARELGRPLHLRNVAVNGQAVFQCLAKFPRMVGPLFDANAAFNIIAFHAGDNDIAHGMTARQTYTSLTRYIAKAHAQGWKVVLSTELDRPTWAEDKRAALAAYNAMMLRNDAASDAVLDYAAAPGMSNPNRATSGFFSPDLVHPSDKGYKVLARLLADAIRKLIEAPGRGPP